MEFDIYQIDAFTNRVFGGNPAAVVPLKEWLPDETLLNIALENNLSETAFFVKTDNGYHLRWFTPAHEVQLCGHATLASAHVIFRELNYEGNVICFETLSGPLYVECSGEGYVMDFPAATVQPQAGLSALCTCLGSSPEELFLSSTGKYLAVYEKMADVEALSPDYFAMKKTGKNWIATAPGAAGVDFVSRFFAPVSGIDEDPVTGSAHTVLAPFWGERMGKTVLKARQVSSRVGEMECRVDGDRVHISGLTRAYLRGTITV